MLGVGAWHEKVPAGRVKNLAFRRRLNADCRADAGLRKAVREACRADIRFYVNAWVWQFNPRRKGTADEIDPFVTWDFQGDALLKLLGAIENDHDALIEKSREMGASWMCLIAFEWLWHFHKNKQLLVISRSAEAVDDPSPDSLFWKIDFIHRHLPDWLMPLGWTARRDRQQMIFKNPETDSTITGEASTGRAGVGGRATAMFIDEFSQIKEGYEVLHRTSDTTGCRIFNGTHLGQSGAFFELTQRVDMPKLVLHWTQHPEKVKGLYRWDVLENKVEVLDTGYTFPPDYQFVTDGSPTGGPFPGIRSVWYDEQCKRKGSARAVAIDLDINPQGSVSQFFDAITVKSLIAEYATAPFWEGTIHYERDTGRHPELVPGAGGPLKLWVHPTHRGGVPHSTYAAGADCAAGTGATPTCMSVIDGRTGVKVAEYADPFVSPEEFAPYAVALCNLFSDGTGEGAAFAWELAGPGLKFSLKVIELGYRNVYYRTDEHDLVKKVSTRPGWTPTPNNKRTLLDDYRAALYGRRIENRSERALKETLAFKYGEKGDVLHAQEASLNDPTGARVNHADRVIADALAWKMASVMATRRPEERADEPPPGSPARAIARARDQTQEAW